MQWYFILAALGLPLIAFYLWSRTERVIYRGEGTVFPPDPNDKPVRKDRRYVTFLVEQKAAIAGDITMERAEKLAAPKVVELEVRQRLFGKPWVETVTWEPGGKPEVSEQKSNGLFLGVYYLLGGLFLMTAPTPLWSLAALVMSGFIMGGVTSSQLDMTEMAPGQKIALWIWLFLSGFGSIVLFQEMTFFTFFPGTILAFAFGQIAGMFALAWGQAERKRAA